MSMQRIPFCPKCDRPVVIHGPADVDPGDLTCAACADETAGPCEKCGGLDTEFRSGTTCGMDVDYRECNSCSHQWDQT